MYKKLSFEKLNFYSIRKKLLYLLFTHIIFGISDSDFILKQNILIFVLQKRQIVIKCIGILVSIA